MPNNNGNQVLMIFEFIDNNLANGEALVAHLNEMTLFCFYLTTNNK